MIRPGADAGLAQPGRERIDLAPRGAIDDARVAAVAGEHVVELPLQIARASTR